MLLFFFGVSVCIYHKYIYNMVGMIVMMFLNTQCIYGVIAIIIIYKFRHQIKVAPNVFDR